MLGMFLALVAISAQAEAAAMLFKVSGSTGGTFSGGSFTNSTFWLSLNVADNPVANPNGFRVSNTVTGSLFRVGNWATDPNFVVSSGSAIFGDNVGAPGFEQDSLRFVINFVGGSKLDFTFSADNSLGQTNEITKQNMYKFLYSINPPTTNAAWSGTFAPSGGTVTAIPEPGSMAVLGLVSCGLGGFVARRKMKKKEKSVAL